MARPLRNLSRLIGALGVAALLAAPAAAQFFATSRRGPRLTCRARRRQVAAAVLFRPAATAAAPVSAAGLSAADLNPTGRSGSRGPPAEIHSDVPPARPLPAPMSLPPSGRPGGGTIQSQPLAPLPGTAAPRRAGECAASAAAGGSRRRAGRAQTPQQPRNRRHGAAARRRGRGGAAAATHHQSDRGLRRARQDQRPHHQVRRRHRRDGAVRRAAGDAARVLFAAADRDAATPTPSSRSTR